ncbi:MAG: BatA domain-containing protein [Planctomycetaceae bacterium]|nr:BatA domain-containing protein [Planctomycetaceae bacterium]
MWLLTSPVSLLALAAIPVLIGIYLFRTRSRRYVVSSLFLWADQQQSRQGGRRLDKLQTPLTLFLEALILALIAIAAAGPNLRDRAASHPTVVVLDASYSMSAGFDGDTPQKRALDDLAKFLRSSEPFPVQFVLAGTETETISGRATSAPEAIRMLDQWHCNAPAAVLDSAIGLASNLSVADVKILVITDQPPKVGIPVGKIEWRAYGKPLDNIALTGASRVFQGEKDKLLIEATNFSPKAQTLQLQLTNISGGAPVERIRMVGDAISTKERPTGAEKLQTNSSFVLKDINEPIEAQTTLRYHVTLPDGVRDVQTQLANDSLLIDNTARLLPPDRRPVRVSIRDLSDSVAIPLKRGLAATGIAKFDDTNPEICFTSGHFSETEQPVPDLPPGCWTMRFYTEIPDNQAEAFVGPFIIDKTHPIMEGLSLEGIVWTAGTNQPLPGYSMLAVGNTPLLSEQNRPDRTKSFHLQWRPDLSTLAMSPGWPILFWNILQYRAEHSPGIRINNIRLGTSAIFNPFPGDDRVQIVTPGGATRTMTVRTDRLSIPADEVGVYTIKAPSGEYRFSSLPPASEESDLTQAVTGVWGGWLDQETLRTDYKNMLWLPLLIASVLLFLHLVIIARNRFKNPLPIAPSADFEHQSAIDR